jgi:hypothetical protein
MPGASVQIPEEDALVASFPDRNEKSMVTIAA